MQDPWTEGIFRQKKLNANKTFCKEGAWLYGKNLQLTKNPSSFCMIKIKAK